MLCAVAGHSAISGWQDLQTYLCGILLLDLLLLLLLLQVPRLRALVAIWGRLVLLGGRQLLLMLLLRGQHARLWCHGG